MGFHMKSHHAFNDEELLTHAITVSGDESQLAKHLGRSFRTVDVWKHRRKLPQGVREHLLLLLDHALPCGCKEVPEAKRKLSGG